METKEAMMQSSLTWVDLTEADQRRAREIIRSLGPQETRDELGLGTLRDAIANLFFPGTTTLQTRARYFLFTPWLYTKYETLPIQSLDVQRRLWKDEVRLIKVLKEGLQDGVIGERAGQNLQRFPSSIYWNGVRTWGILRLNISQSGYHRSWDQIKAWLRTQSATDDHDPVEGRWRTAWDMGLPRAPAGFPGGVIFDLRQEEAEYLRERALLSCGSSLWPTLLIGCKSSEVDFVWLHPELSSFPQDQQACITQAQNLSDVLLGAAWLYNLMLSELQEADDWVRSYQVGLLRWRDSLSERWRELVQWDRDGFWTWMHGVAQIPSRTRQFAESWMGLVLAGRSPPDVASSAYARDLIQAREGWLKGARSRFSSPQHLAQYKGEAGTRPLDYRWRVARRIANDILRGLDSGRE